MACIIDPRFKECKFLGPEKHIQVKGALTGLVCKEKASLEGRQSSVSSHTIEVNEPATKKRCSGLAILLGDDYTNENTISDSVLLLFGSDY